MARASTLSVALGGGVVSVGIAQDAESDANLLLVVHGGIEFRHAAFKSLPPTHIKPLGNLLVVAAGHIADGEHCGLRRRVESEGEPHGVKVVAVVGLAFEAEDRANLEVFPSFVGVVILAARHVKFIKIKLTLFHGLKGLMFNYSAKLATACAT